jgi:hypothetical protein
MNVNILAPKIGALQIGFKIQNGNILGNACND